MKAAVLLITTLLLTHKTHATCAKGTLLCDTTGSEPKSTVCDFISGYFPKSDGTCETKTIEGCELNYYSEDQKPCVTCKAGLVLDSAKTKCVAVADDKKKDNCQRYNKESSDCANCNPKYYLSGGACKAVTTEVENCLVYISATTCQTCNDGYYLKEKVCVKIDTVENCQMHTDRQCDGCNVSYYLNRGYNQTINLDNSLYLQIANNLTHTDGWSFTNNTHSICEKITVENCKELASSGTCTTCHDGYFVNEAKACELNPEDPIAECAKYSSATVCIKCNENFYLKNATTCDPVSKVPNCKTYTLDQNSCEVCEDTHYLSLSECKERGTDTKAISNCKKISLIKDECEECMADYKPTLDNKKCLPEIKNCKTPEYGSSKNDLKHICKECTKEFYLKNNSCISRTVKDCTDYGAIDKDECTTCNDGYWRESATQCTKNAMPGCTKYETNLKDCKTCEVKTYKLLNTKICEAKSISQCAEYTDDPANAVCMKCENRLKPTSNGSGCEAGDIANCATTDGKGKCSVCNSNHTLIKDGSECLPWTTADAVQNCLSTKVGEKNKCEYCIAGFYLENDTTCTQRVNSLNKCKTYNRTQDICDSCETTEYKTSSANICTKNDAKGCNGTSMTDNKCTACATDFYSTSTTFNKDCISNTATGCLEKSKTLNKCKTCQPTHYGSSEGATKDCLIRTRTNCKTGGQLELFKDECNDCNQGEYLDSKGACVSVTTIKNCKSYMTKEDKCNECEDGYYKSSDSKLCKLYPDGIANCATFSSRKICTSCKKMFYLDNNTCKAVTISEIPNCKTYSSATKCSSCNTNHFHNQTDNKCEAYDSSANCGTHLTKDTCKDCKANHVMDTSTKRCQASGIAGCVLAEKGTPNLCTKCESGKLLASDKKSCTSPSPPITNCNDYTSKDRCKQCIPGYFLSLDGKTCSKIENVAGTNCSYGKQLEKPICDVCKYGFEKDKNGACVALADPNCVIYNATTKKCSFCFPGSWMDKDGKCNKDVPTPESANVFKSLVILGLVTLLGRFF